MAINSTYYLDAATLSLATAVYLDSALSLIAPDGFYGDGTISREQSGGILLTANTCSTCSLQEGQRSTIGIVDPESVDVCAEELETVVYIQTSNPLTITSGDIACNSNDPLDIFDGDNLYYLVSLNGDNFVLQIDNDGEVSVWAACS